MNRNSGERYWGGDGTSDSGSSPVELLTKLAPMHLLVIAAATPTALEKLKQIPPAFWLKIGLAVIALVLIVLIIRKLAGANKVVVGVVAFLIISIVGFNWIYERNEPAWATPVVEKLANFFPAKDAYNATQKKPGKQP